MNLHRQVPFVFVILLAACSGREPEGSISIFSPYVSSKSAITVSLPSEAADYALDWEDGFDDPSLNRTFWSKGLSNDEDPNLHEHWNPNTGGRHLLNSGYLGYILDENVTIENGNLVLANKKLDVPLQGTDPTGEFYHTSGWVTGMGKHSMNGTERGVYVEVRAKWPVGERLWPAIWMTSDTYKKWPPEIDIWEYFGDFYGAGLDRMYNRNIYGSWPDTVGQRIGHNQFFKGVEFWGVYGFLWTRNFMAFYLDNVEIGRFTRATDTSWCTSANKDDNHVPTWAWPNEGMHLILNNALMTGSDPDDSHTIYPNYFEIDYVSVYVDPSPEAPVDWSWPDCYPPKAPSNVNAVRLDGGQYTVTWTDNADNESGFKIQFRLPNSTQWKLCEFLRSPNIESFTTNADAHDANCNVLPPGTDFRIKTVLDRLGGSAWVAVGEDPPDPCSIEPPAPSDVVVTAISDSTLRLTWVDNADDEDHYSYDYAKSTGENTWGPWIEGPTLPANTESADITGLQANTLYSFRIKSYRNCDVTKFKWVGNGNPRPITGTTLQTGDTACSAAPATPTNPTATGVSSSSIRLNWTNDGTETGYILQYAPSQNGVDYGGWVTADPAPGPGTEYLLEGLVAPYYRFRIRAACDAYESAWTDLFVGQVGTDDPPSEPPTAPSGLTSTAVSASQIDLSWTDNSSDEDGFNIQFRVFSGTWGDWQDLLPDNAPNDNAALHSSLTAKTRYQYQVRAYNANGDSDWSAKAEAETLDSPEEELPSGCQSSTSNREVDPVDIAIVVFFYLAFSWRNRRRQTMGANGDLDRKME